MKIRKALAMSFIALITSIVFSSCEKPASESYIESKEELSFTGDENNSAESELIVNLKSINNEILSNSPKSKSLANWQIVAIAAADLRGAFDGARIGAKWGARIGAGLGAPIYGAATFAFIGGCAVGAFDSFVVYQGFNATRAEAVQPLEYATISKVCKSTISDDLTLVDQPIISPIEITDKLIVDDNVTESVLLDEQCLNVGKMHNVILAVADGSVELKVEHNIDNPTITSILDSQDFQDMYNDITYKKLNNIEIERDPLEEEVIDLFCDVFQQYSTTCNDVAYIINKYMEILETSTELTETQLNSIKMGLATSLYSFNYWDKTLN